MTTTRRTMTPGRRWAYGGSALGVGLSVAANVEHVLVQSRTAPAGAVVSAAACPVILLVALEIIARTTWPAGARWQLLRWLALPTVALVAASISYLHMRSLLLAYGESAWAATVGPLAVDGLMAVAVGALLVPMQHPPAGTVPEEAGAPTVPAAGWPERVAQPQPASRTAVETPAPVAETIERPRRPRPSTTSGDDGRAQVLAAVQATRGREAAIIRATGLARRTVRDHLAALVAEGLVVRDGRLFAAAESGSDHVLSFTEDDELLLSEGARS